MLLIFRIPEPRVPWTRHGGEESAEEEVEAAGTAGGQPGDKLRPRTGRALNAHHVSCSEYLFAAPAPQPAAISTRLCFQHN